MTRVALTQHQSFVRAYGHLNVKTALLIVTLDIAAIAQRMSNRF